MAIRFPDVEPLLVSHLQTVLDDHFGAGEVRVGTKKLPADAPHAAREVVVMVQYSGRLDDVRQSATGLIEVYADTYADASDLALVTGALVVDMPREHVKRCVVTVGPMRLEEASPQEKRSLSLDLTVKGVEL